MAEIFAIVRGVINMIQNSVCHRAKLKRSNWFRTPFFRPSSSFEEQTCRRLLDQKEKGFQVLKSTAAIVPTMIMEMFSRAAYAISALYLIYGSLFGCHLAVFYSYQQLIYHVRGFTDFIGFDLSRIFATQLPCELFRSWLGRVNLITECLAK